MLAERENDAEDHESLEESNPLENICLPNNESLPPPPKGDPNLRKATIVVFRNKLYEIEHPFVHMSYAYDYFLARTQKLAAVEKEGYGSYDFSIDWIDKQIQTYEFNRVLSNKTDTFKEYIQHARDVSDKTEAEIFELHKELLRACIVHKLLDSPSKETCKLHENIHRGILKEKIHDFFIKIPESIYKWAHEGFNTVDFRIAPITESVLTRHNAHKILPICSDGVVRSNINDYVYFLLGGLYPRTADEIDPQLWIGSHLANHVRKIYPHFTVETKPSTISVFPKFVLHLNVSTTGILK